MTSRERVIAAIEFESPDRVPYLHAAFPGALWRHGQKVLDLMARYPDDFGNRDFYVPPEPDSDDPFEEYTDEWGCVWRRKKGYTAGEVIKPALENWEQLRVFELPPAEPTVGFSESFRPRLFETGPLAPDRDWYALYGWFDLFERMQFLRGTANLLMDMADDRSELHELADMVTERNLKLISRYLEMGVDGVFFGDDWGTQERLLISPARWRAFFKPRYKRMFDLVRNAGVHVFFHSCGWTVDIWEDLIQLGANVLNVQYNLVPKDVLDEKLVGRVCICPDPDRQHILPLGTPEEVRRHIQEIVSVFDTSRGGLIQRGELDPQWPFENIVAMYEAFNKD